MKFTQLAAVIASLILSITSLQVSAETEVEADFQDAVIQDSIIETTAESVRNNKSGNQGSGGVIILNTNRNDNQNDSAANAEADAVAVSEVDTEVVAVAETQSQSQADAMRNARQSAEVSTEQRIVEKLEYSRLEDERRRADALFGDRFEDMDKKVIKKKIIKVDEDDYSQEDEHIEKKVIVKEVIKETAPVQSQVVAIQPPQYLANDRTYMGFSLGGISYDAVNVESNYAAGVMIGQDLGNKVSVEGSFMFSNHFVDTFWVNPLYSEVSQYDVGLTAKYTIFTGMLKPFVGAGINYVYRNYQDRLMTIDQGFGSGSQEFGAEANTHAVDGSLLAGLDIELSRNFTLGAEFKYSSNVYVQNDEPVFAQRWAQPTFGKPLEEIDRSQVTVNAKFMF
jgi:opacity protein-like surface antigen